MPFCRITGGSRALPKPNYFPLLPPISPADARRFCRITGKAIGLPGHHYIPVLVGLGVGREHCHITHKSEGGNDHHQFLGLQPRRHTVLPGYRYVFPVLDEESDLLVLLDSKTPAGAAQGADEARKYVYTVDERRTSLVFPSRLEAAVRDGDVRDVMLARDADHLLLTLRKGKSVSLDVRDYSIVEDELWEGEGPGEVAYQRDEEDRKRRQKREAGLADRKRIFEAKEDLAAQEERRRHSAKVMKVKMQAERAAEKAARKKAKQSGPRKWNRFEVEEASADAHLYLASGELKELAKPLVGAFDAEAFVKEAPIRGESTITTLPTPVDVPAVVVDLETSSPGIVQQPALLEEVGGFPTVHAVAPFAPLTAEPSAELQSAVQLVDPGALPRQAEVKAVLMEEGEDGKLLNQLPRIEEIPDLVNMLDKGEAVNIGGKVHALRLDIAAAQGAGAQSQRLVVGQSVETPSGRVFVPGQTVETANGPVFMPGLTVHTPDGPLLIPGQAVEAPGSPGQQVFVAGQALHTRDGHKFVQGQMLYSADGEGRFAPGQTVLTPEGPRFVPGQVIKDGTEFVVGQTVNTPNGPKFVPGQTLTTPSGEAIFLPGQSVEVEHADGEKEWAFVPGQAARADNGDLRFIPGQTITTADGPKFVAGQTVVDEAGGAPQFVPGVSVHDEKTGALKFVPGTTLETADGLKFIEGQVIKTEKGVKFSPGSFVLGADGVTVVEFTPAISLADIIFRDGPPNPGVENALEQREEVLGHMVQTSHGVEFFPGKANGLPSGKVIQGKLVKSSSGAVQFVPGMDIDGVFVPGQLVMTELGEQFVPGQVVDTKEGPKFVPGQVVETQAGPKFLPGQTVLTADGPRFVPGQIIETKAGPTFIPGQVICTEEEGSRFVPGQIVDTREGPRFVPGRVIETGDRVTFVPGQIVETADGLRFVAPDLQDTEEGGFEFSLQGFEVTPEELRLMRPHLSATSTAPTTAGQMSIDSRMLRQLSHAGMVVGKQVAAELPGVDVSSLPTLALAEQLGLEGVSAVKMGHVLEAVLKLSYGLLDERGHVRRKMSVTIERGLLAGGVDVEALTQEEEALKNMLTEAIVTACITMDEQAEEEDVLRAVCNFFNSILESVRDKDGVVEALHGFVTYPGHVGLLCRETVCQLGQGLSRADLLRSLLWGGEDVLDRLGKVLEQDQLGQAFLHLAEAEPELMEVVLRRVTEAVRAAAAEGMDGLDSDQDAAEVLQRAIVAVVREASELRLQEMLDSDELALRELLVQAINLARALGMHETAHGLLQVLSDPSATRVLAGDRITLDILQRLTVMRQLAERRPKFNSALGKLVSDPETARNDPRLRELVRQSAALMVVPEDQCLPELQSSADIPTALFHNTLAMEEYLRRRGAGTKGALLIVKLGFQTVIPREAARDVLTGQIPYTLVDQKGIRHFAPMHVFSALRLSQPLANRYSMYHSRRGSAASGASVLSSVAEDRPEAPPAPPSTVPSTCLRCIHGDHRHHSTFSQPATEVADVLTAREDVVGERLSLKKGDLVEVLDTTDAKRPRLDLHSDPDLDLGIGADAASLLDNSSARHKMSVRPRRKHADPRARSPAPDTRWLVRLVSDPSQCGWVPASSLERRASTCWPSPPSSDHQQGQGRGQDAKYRREAVVRELVETEEEFGRDMRHVVDRYMVPVDAPSVPRVVRDNKTLVFGNLKEIAEFHNTVLIEGIKYYADEPRMIGKTFLRLERDFDKHVAYCRDEPQAQEFLLDTPEARDFYEELSQKLGDDKNLSEHLKLPIQRINDYQLLLKELVRYSSRLGEDTTDLGRALELMLGVPHRANDIKFISNIEGYHGNIYKLGRLLRHDWFTVIDRDGKNKERYLFLFKARILVCKVRRISEDRSVFVLKDIIRLPEVEVKDIPDNARAFQLRHQDGEVRPYPLTISAHNDSAKDAWLKEIRLYAADSLALAEHAADDLHIKDDEAVSSSVTEPPQQPQPPRHKVIIHKVQIEEPKTPEPLIEEPVTPAADASALKRKDEPLAELEDSKKAKVVEEVFEDALEHLPEEEEGEKDVAPQRDAVREEAKQEESKQEGQDAVQNGDGMSEYISRRSSVRRAGSSRTEVEESYSVSRSSRHELYSESSLSGTATAAGTMSSIRSSSRLESSSSRYSSGDVGGDLTSSIRGSSAAAAIESSSSYLRGGRSSITESSSSRIGGSETSSSRTSIREQRSSIDGASSAITSGKRRPSFVKTLEGNHCEPGETATFECSVAGSESASVTWLKDNKPLSDRLMDRVSKSSVDNTFKLEIQNLIEADTGMYTAHATNAEGTSTCTAHLLVQKLTDEERKQRAEANHPVFLVKLKDTELLENTYLRFMVKVKGNPNPTVRFYKDDSRILSTNDRLKVNSEQSDAGYYELIIPEVKPEDAGKYSCVAINSYGEERCDAQLSVVDDKDVFAGLEESEVAPGVAPTFHWTRNGQQFDPEERFKVLLTDEEDSLALVFQHVKPEDAGLYTCVAQTSSGKISCSAELTVQGGVNALQKEPQKPTITVETKTQEVSIGGSAMLELKVEGSPKPEIAWTKDGQDVKAGGRIRFLYEDDESMSMIIKGVTPEDAGTYTVTAWNDMGEDFAEVTLNVKAPPKFKSKMKDQACMTDDTLRVTVEVEGTPAPDLSWYKDGQEISSSDERFHIVKETSETYVLVIEKMRLEDSGSYSVVLRNEVSQTSEFYKVAVQSPPFFTQKIAPRKIEVREGDFTTFTVKVDGDPKPRVRWFKDDEELLNDDRHIKIESDRDGETHTLTIRGINRDDMGKYTCELDNRNGRVSDSTTMHVHCVPVVKQKLKDIVSKEGELNIVFEVTIEAFPQPEIKWFQDEISNQHGQSCINKGVEVTERKTLLTRSVEEKQIYLKTYKLTMKEVKVEQAGVYTCKATNTMGETESSSEFKVLYVPKITKKLEDVKLDEGETLTLNIEANGVPVPDVAWYKDGQKLSAQANANIKITRDKTRQESYSMTLDLCKYQDSGEYECRVSNDQGVTSTKCNVVVNALGSKPVVTKHNMQDSQIFESLAKVYEVRCIGEPKPVATWYKDGEEVVNGEGIKVSESGEIYKLEVPYTLIPKDEGVYKLHLENRLGVQDLECNLKLIPVEQLRKPIIKQGLKDTTAKKGEQAVLKAVITGDPVPDIKWWKDGEPLLPDKDPNVIINCDTKFIQDDLKECTYSVTIPSARHKDTGQYSLKATNKFGSVESSALLNIILRPEIEGMKDKTGIPTTITQFEVIIHANPAADVKWLKDEKPIVADDHFEVFEDRENEKYTLRVNDTATDDHGVYTVTARNSQGEASKSAQLSLHTEKPSFVKDLVDRIIKDDSPVEFKVRVNGDPKPKITWLKDDREVVVDDRVTVDTSIEGQVTSVLAISNVWKEDVARYTCVATNMVGEARTSAQLNMDQAPPMVTIPLDKCIEVDEGEPLEIKGKIDGSPVPLAKWFKDSVEIDPNDPHVKLTLQPDGTVKLNIDEVKHNDGGAYKVVAYNKNGEMASMCAVAVKPKPRAPEFAQPLENVSVQAGQPLKLEALVTAFPVPEVKWFKDGHPIRPSKEVNFINDPVGHVGLVIDSARPEDAGVYTVKVANKLGAIEGKAEVQVQERERRPMFHAQLLPQKVVEGFPVRMEVKVVGHPPPELTWTCNGKEIKPDGKNIKLLSQPDGSHVLVIEKVGPEHAGEYTVTATNDQGSVSSSAPLEVQGKTREGEPEAEPSFLREPRDTTADEGGPLSMSATFQGNPIPDVTWLKDGEPLQPSERVKVTCDGKKVGLEINPCNLGDVGRYTCRLSNPLGSAEAAAQGNVRKVFTPASFLQKFTDMQQIPGLDAKFMARIGGNPKPTVSWFYNGKPIAESDKYHMKRDDDHICLYVKDCTPKDNGTYTCKIANSAGKDMCNGDLEVVDKIEKKQKMEAPSFLKKIGDCEVVTGMSAKFTACVNGFPEPEYEWYRNGKRIEPSDRFIMESGGSGLLRLIVKDTDPADVGTYRLRIFNPHGEASCEAELKYDTLDSTGKRPISDQYQDFKKVKTSGVPLPLPNAPIISRMTDRRLTLSWRPSIPIGPRTPVTYQVEMCELPDGEWFTVRTGIRSCACDVHNLEPFRNYKFRIRVENKYGISEPSPYAITHREKLEPPPPRFFPYLEPGIDFRPETSPYFPKDFDIEKPPHDGYAQAPRFLRQEHDTQYGVKNHNCNLFWFVYGYPKPKMKYYFNDEEIESGGRFDHSYTRNGQATLFINKMLERDVGWYEAVATNEHGEARQRVRLEIAEYPVFIKRPEETTMMLRKGTRLEARVVGVPYPDIKWFKDWMPIFSSERVKISFVEPDTCHLHISDAINKDEGLYSITASNVAGSVSTSVMVHVEEDERRYWDQTYMRPKPVRAHKEVPLSEAYDLGDELGRGTQGITYHAVERSTGRNFAAKVMHGKDMPDLPLRKFMENELEMMSLLHHRRLVRLHDAFETHNTFTLVTDLAGGGELLDTLTSRPFYTEWDVAHYIRQLLEGLEHMHGLNVAHLGLTVGDLLISHPGGDDLKICDFGLARRISSAGLQPLLYGMPEFVAPEVMRGEGVSLSADMWSVGIITYLLLSGRSLFRGENDRETLTKIKEGKWYFDEDLFANYSAECRDFITKLLAYIPGARLNVEQALQHPWFDILGRTPHDPYRMSSDALKNYYNLYKDWYSNASCRNWYRRRPLEGAFTHPSKMVYPPYERYTPAPTPEREPYRPRNWEEEIHTGGTDLNYEIGLIKSESHYQNGPDTYLLQLRDVDFPVRLREYLKVAANRGPGYSRIVTDQSHLDWRAPVIRERRRFTDVMDEEIDDERKARINKYGSGDVYSLRRLRHELGTRLDGHAEAEAIMQTKHEEHDGTLPFFREKPQTVPIVANEVVEIACLAVGDPKPLVQWYKCDMVVQETVRISFKEDEEGRSILRLGPAHNMDIGIYKVVARNKGGQTVARFRVVLAGVPSSPDSPDVADVSDDEVFLRWKQPKDDGNTAVICYALQYKEVDGDQWLDVAKNIDHEFFVVKNLQQMSRYYFRLAAKNRVGWSDYGIPIKVKTKPLGVPKVQITRAMAHLQSITESGAEVNEMEAAPKLDYTVENRPINWIPEHDVSDKYHFISEISRGRFSVVVKGVEKSNDHIVSGKLLELNSAREVAVNREFEALRRLRHERIAQLLEAYRAPGSEVAVLILEKLQGADILTYFSSRHEYNEQMVCNVVSQVLDGLQYLHWRGLCHLDLQPDNIVMASVRSLQVKLVDLGSAQTVSKLGTLVDRVGHIEYSSPEMLNDEPVYPQSDMWSLGVVTYVLLSGVSPFRGENNEETRQNILFVRYRFEHLFKELSQEATRFLMLVFKRTPSKRPTIEECHEHRWLLPTEFMIKKRERASFLGIRLKDFCDEYHTMRARQAINADSLVGSMSSGDSGRRLTLSRSDSITEELSNAFQNGAVV